MKPNLHHVNITLKLICGMTALAGVIGVQALTWPSRPLGATISATPMTMLVAARDHKLFYEAYNDNSDVDGDGTLDIRFKPSITYYGYFDSTLCYSHNNKSNNTGLFTPAGNADASGHCTSSTAEWSGNWLNYMTTSRIDALRKVLYGGMREVDSTTNTILRRAYIPQDSHSWGKEYHSVATDGYDIRDYTPFDLPTAADKRHFFGSLTANRSTNCSTLDNCSNMPPLLRVRTNVGSDHHVWEWASKERPVLEGSLSTGAFPAGTDAEKNYTVRVQVCTSSYHLGCKNYSGTYKPIGLLHEYGESNAMLFGLLTGSYDNHMSGGRLRKVISSFSDEVDPATGIFDTNAKIVNTFNLLRIRGYNQSSSSGEYWKSNPYADSAKAATEGQFVDWGNPIGEMLYEATRYYAGKKSATADFNTATTIDKEVGLKSETWDDPYDSTSAAKAAYCSRANFLTISDVNPSFDSDTIPGSYFNTYVGDIFGLDVKVSGDTITAVESNLTGMRFIGQSEGTYDAAPTAKNVNSLGTIRGLAPEEPTKKGSYYSASMSYFAKTTDLRSGLTGKQTVDNYVVALSSPLPQIEATLPNGRIIRLVPFSKSVGGAGISATKGAYQPTNQIVDFYVQQIANSGPADADASVNGGRYQAVFQINFEDVEQGGDHDMDAISKYTVTANADNTLSVTVQPMYQAGGIYQNMGYVISGSTHDGVYLVARDEVGSGNYFLNVPAGRTPGYCDVGTPPADCATLPKVGDAGNTFVFTPGTGGATLLRDPLWYAAKFGGFVDRNSSNTPDLPSEWDSDNNGVPDTYFLVQNPLKLRDALKRAFDTIVERNGSGGNIIANSTTLSTSTLVFQGVFNSSKWSGDLIAYPATASAGVSTIAAWNAALKLPGPALRNIFYSTSSGNGDALPVSSFPGSWSATLKGYFNSSTDLLQYLRGERSKELLNGGTYRDRKSDTVLGDITHSSPVFVKDTDTVYVGANDGMLHGFDVNTGVEQLAFIPSAVLPRLKNLSDLNYNDNHEFFVDGDIAVSSRGQTTNKNYLVAALGRGGKGLFGLDVTSPTSFAKTDINWEYFDATDTELGYMLGRPVIAQMNDNTWAVIIGNGYNSTSGKAALYIFNLTNGNLIKKIVTAATGDNGLATPGVYDSNNDGKVDAIYAGDLTGNVWKFDVSSSSTASWGVANSGNAIFEAKDSASTAQPITAPISIAINNDSSDPNFNSVHLFFGTGSYFQTGDPATTSSQTWYSIIDRGTTLAGRTNLVQRSINLTGTFDGKPVRSFALATAGDTAGKDGCFIDLPESGERMVTASKLFSLAEPTLIGSSIIPVVDQCVPGGNGYVNAINPFTCGRLTKPFFDVNDNGSFADDLLGTDNIGSIDLGVGMPGEAIILAGTGTAGYRLAVGGTNTGIGTIRVQGPGGGGGGGVLKGRISWREIIRN